MMREWVHRAIAFTDSLKEFGHGSDASTESIGPISTGELATLQDSLPVSIPPPYAEFLTTASSSLSCYYSIVVYREPTEIAKKYFADHLDLMEERVHGGPTFFGTKNIADGIQLCLDGADGLSDVWPESSARWLSAFPLVDIGNGDMVAFDVANTPNNPPIVYLSHDEDIVRTISPTFTAFLSEWEKFNYIGLEIWSLEEWGFLDSTTGYLSANAGDLAGLLEKFKPQPSAG